MFEELHFQAGKLKASLERLKDQISTKSIDRLQTRALLLDFQMTFYRIRDLILKEWDSLIQSQSSSDLLNTFVQAFGAALGHREIESSLGTRISVVASAS